MAYMPPQPPPQPPWGYDPRFYPQPRKSVDLSSGHLPIALVITGFAFVAWATYYGTGTLKSIETSQERILNKVETYAQRSDERAARLESALAKSDREGFSKTDHALWCAKTEAANREWKCADSIRADHTGDEKAPPPIWHGFGKTMAEDWQTSVSPGRSRQ
jgi:hypothetical protein